MACLGGTEWDERGFGSSDGFWSAKLAISGLVGGEDLFEAIVGALLSASESDLVEAAADPDRVRMSGAL